MLAGKQKEVHLERDRELEEAPAAHARIHAHQIAERYTKRSRPESRAMLVSNLSAESMPKASSRGVEIERHSPGTCNLHLATMR